MTPATKKVVEALNDLLDRYTSVIGNEGIECYKARAALTALRQEQAEPTEFQRDEAWANVRKEVGTDGWTVGDHCNYRGFFDHGWRAGLRANREKDQS